MMRSVSFFSLLGTYFNRYILLLLLKRLVFLTFAAVLLMWTIQSLHFVSLIAAHGMSLKVFFQLTLLLLPNFLQVILPLSCFAVILFTYERLEHDRELVILQENGFSPLQLSAPALCCALLSMLGAYGLTLWAVPASYHAFHKQEFHIRNALADLFLEEGVFNHLPNGMTIYVQKKNENRFKGAVIEQQAPSGERTLVMAETGSLLHHRGGLELLLRNGSRQVMREDHQSISFVGFGEKRIPILLPRAAPRQADPQELPLKALFHPPEKAPPALKGKFYAEGMERIASPLYCPAFALLALSWMLGGRPRLERYGYMPVLGAVSCAGLLLGGNFLLKSFVLLHPSVAALLLCLPLLPILFALFFLFKHSMKNSLLPPCA